MFYPCQLSGSQRLKAYGLEADLWQREGWFGAVHVSGLVAAVDILRTTAHPNAQRLATPRREKGEDWGRSAAGGTELELWRRSRRSCALPPVEPAKFAAVCIFVMHYSAGLEGTCRSCQSRSSDLGGVELQMVGTPFGRGDPNDWVLMKPTA